MAIELVDLPIVSIVIFHSFFVGLPEGIPPSISETSAHLPAKVPVRLSLFAPCRLASAKAYQAFCRTFKGADRNREFIVESQEKMWENSW